MMSELVQAVSEKEWREYEDVLTQKAVAALQAVMGRIPVDADLDDAWTPLANAHADRLRERYAEQELTRYLAWHVLRGGNEVQAKSPFLDFPGELSVAKFFDSIIDGTFSSTPAQARRPVPERTLETFHA